MSDIVKKRYYIYENISKIRNHNNIIDYLKLNKCKYTENKNGIFVNLNTIDDDKIHHIYMLTYDAINHYFEDELVYDTTVEGDDKFKVITENVVDEYINTNDIFLSEYSEEERKIIEYSKLYF